MSVARIGFHSEALVAGTTRRSPSCGLCRDSLVGKRHYPETIIVILNALSMVDTINFVSTQLFVRRKRLTTMVTFKRTRRLISPNVSPDFRIGDFFLLIFQNRSINPIDTHSSTSLVFEAEITNPARHRRMRLIPSECPYHNPLLHHAFSLKLVISIPASFHSLSCSLTRIEIAMVRKEHHSFSVSGSSNADGKSATLSTHPGDRSTRSGRPAARGNARREMLPLGLCILLSGRRHAMDDRHADQTENTHPDPLHRHVEHIGSDRQASDQYDVSDEVNSK